MAIITISRQLASLGDEIAIKIAEKLGYKFFGKKELEKRILSLGFPQAKLSKFDERKLGFFAGLTHIRDEYLNYLMTAILEAASENNCVIVGRGSFIILKELENHVSCRFIADKSLRMERLQKNFDCTEKEALKKISDSEIQQKAFHKDFFNFDVNDPEMFDLLVNTSRIDSDSIVDSVAALANTYVTPARNEEGQKKINEILIGQRIVDILIFIYNLNIEFLRATMKDKKITLHGIADSQKTLEAALTIVEAELPGYEIASSLTVGRDFARR